MVINIIIIFTQAPMRMLLSSWWQHAVMHSAKKSRLHSKLSMER